MISVILSRSEVGGPAAIRYTPEHKRQTRDAILAAARRLFRRHGYEGVGVDAIMEAAGLTRGGFYRHFRSKSELFAEALAGHHDFVERMAARTGCDRRELAEQALSVVRDYLAPANREPVGRGCSLASLAADASRGSRRARRAYGEAVRELATELARGLEDPQPADPRALAAIALCVGGLGLSRAVADPELADAISHACAEAAERELARPPSASVDR
jgi:AcrR family transcriptional regulator